jgi:hypothetical protein
VEIEVSTYTATGTVSEVSATSAGDATVTLTGTSRKPPPNTPPVPDPLTVKLPEQAQVIIAVGRQDEPVTVECDDGTTPPTCTKITSKP